MANSRARTSAKRGAAGVDLDTDAFIAGLREATKKLVVRTEADVLRLGYKVQAQARTFCPVDTGRLRASIDVVEGRDSRGYFVKVGTNVTYAPYVEFGTAHSPAQPYMRPAMLAATRSWKP